MGLTGRVLLQSGNLVFQSDGRTGAKLERMLEVQTESSRECPPTTSSEPRLVERSLPAIHSRRQRARQPSSSCSQKARRKQSVEALQAAIRGPEIVRSDGKQVYVVYPAGIGRSKLTSILIEQKLGSRGTGRNWNTVLKLAALIQG
jgi:uncharacterized protein (DUF1697 family)